MPDVVLMGATYQNVPSIIVPSTGGNSAQFYDMSKDYSWMGIDTEFVENVFNTTTKLSATGFSTWSPSNTAANIQSASANTTRTLSFIDYEYCVEYLWETDFVFPSGTTEKGMPVIEYGAQYYFLFRRASNLASIEAGTSPYNVSMSLNASSYYEKYYNGSGSLTHTATTGYGIWLYYSGSEPALSSTSANSPTVTIRNPAIRARCSDTYFSTARAAEIDTDKTVIKIKCNLYRMKVGSCALKNGFEAARRIYEKPL